MALTTRKVESIKEPGMYGDGGGLYLNVGPQGSRSWILRTVIHGRRRDIGLGSAKLVSLAEAREEARSLRKVARAGGDPTAARKRVQLTFEQATMQVLASLKPTWKSERHGEIWLSALKRYAFPMLASRPIETVTTPDLLKVLAPIWTEKNDTAKRVKQRLGTIFDWAKGAGHYSGENPVVGLAKALPQVSVTVEHMAALPWQELPGFLTNLRKREGVSARALEFIILTCARSGEVRGARWSEIDGEVWTVPAERMKMKRPHRVPLSPRALEVLEAVRGLDPELIFPSPSLGRGGKVRQMSDTVFAALMDRMGVTEITTHGFRSTFRDWASEHAHADREVAEICLAHTVGSKVEQAYARSDLFERRRKLMLAWESFASGKAGQVVQMVRGA